MLTPSVSTLSASGVSETTANVEINVNSSGSGTVRARGVVYSCNNSSPTLGNSNSVAISGTTGFGGVFISDLSPDTLYYVRAYATNGNGTSYGEVRTFSTLFDNPIVATTSVTNITGVSATANGSIVNPLNYTVVERGFVYSDRSNAPTVMHTLVPEIVNINTASDYSLEIKGLNVNTTYHLRSYIKVSNGTIYYGKPISFTTSLSAAVTLPAAVPGAVYTGLTRPTTVDTVRPTYNPNANLAIDIVYKDTKGVVVGTQTVFCAASQVISITDLVMPAGFMLRDPQWQYRVIASTQISVNVTEGRFESNFMPVGNGFMFRPDELITRIDIAQALFNLSNKVSGTNPGVFSDVKNDQRKPAVDYVTSKNYMTGTGNGLFNPEGSVTRAEIAVIICNYYNLVGAPTITFTDVGRDHWAYHYIAVASESVLMSAYPDGSFRPDEEITRAEVTVLLSIASNRSLEPITIVGFSDVFETHWAYKYIMNAATPMQ